MTLPTEQTPSTKFAITITLDPSMYGHDIETQYDMTIKPINEKLREICSEFELRPETTKDANLHYHGTLTMKKEIIKKYKYADTIIVKIKDKFRTLRYKKKIIGFIVVKKIDNLEKWSNYIVKESPVIEDLLGKTIKFVSIQEFKDD